MNKSVSKIKKLSIVFLIVIAAALTLCSCKGKKASSFTGQGMDAIAALDYDSALNLLSQAEEANENLQLVKRGEGIAYMGLSRYDEAVDALEESLHNGSWRVGALERDTNYYLAAAFEKNDDHENAIEVYDAIIDMWPKEKTALKLRGFVYLNDDDFESANRDFASAIKIDPTDYDMLIEIFEALDDSGYRQAGEEYLTTVLNEHENDMDAFNKGRIYYYLKDYENARNTLEGARDSGAKAILYLGLAYEALDDYNYATSVYQGYISTRQGDAMIYNQLGVCEMQMGSYEDAFQHFTDGLATEDPACRQSLLFNQISACEHMGDFSKAKSLMNEYLKLYPDDERAQREQIFLSTR